MDFNEILKPEIQRYIQEKSGEDTTKLALQKNPFPEIDFKIILNQIEARSKSKNKLSTWFHSKNIIYPSKISVEQTSSEITADYKSTIVSGNSLIDLSGGFGVDDFYFSKKVNTVIHCEINADLSKIVSHNFEQLNAKNIVCITGDSELILKELHRNFDWMYIDPSRRNDAKGKVFMLKDCLPNVPDLQDFYHTFSKNILIKTAPILDIAAGLSELKNVKAIHIIAVANEVKELLWEIEYGFENSPIIKTVNLSNNNMQKFDFEISTNHQSTYDLPKKYLYEPNSAIMKSGGFNEVALQFSLDKLHHHSHLYTANQIIEFPGRVFEIQKIVEYSKKEMTTNFLNKQFNITTRNFPETVDTIRKKWKIKDGGNHYCFFTTNLNDQKIVLICTKINHS